jgi:hypothetical protein
MEIALYDVSFTDGYPTVTACGPFSQVLLRASAKKIGDVAAHVGKRAKHDLTFCKRLAPLVCARFTFSFTISLYF